MKNFSNKIKIFFTVAAFFVFFKPAFAANPNLFFNVPELGVKQGNDFDTTIKIDTAGQNVTGADVVLQYNPDLIEVVKIENGGFFPLFGKHFELNNQKIYITGFFTEKNQSKNGNGIFAKLTLKALKNGATNLQFMCLDKSLSDTNIIGLSGNDLIQCKDLISLKVSITGGNLIAAASSFGKILGTESGELISPTVTQTPSLTPTIHESSPSTLMESGVFDNSIYLFAFGISFISFGFALFLYSKKSTS